MAKKSEGGCAGVFVVLVAIGVAAWEWVKANQGLSIAIVIAVSVVSFVLYKRNVAKRKREHEEWVEYLWGKYQDEEIVRLIIGENLWVGQTEEQLKDSVGRPDKIDEKILKTKKKEIWKYKLIQAGQYQLKVTLDNGAVVGWDQKDR